MIRKAEMIRKMMQDKREKELKEIEKRKKKGLLNPNSAQATNNNINCNFDFDLFICLIIYLLRKTN
jgi:hypothetical protein